MATEENEVKKDEQRLDTTHEEGGDDEVRFLGLYYGKREGDTRES